MTLRPYGTSILIGIVFTFLLSTFWFLPQLAFIIFISLLFQLLLYPLVEKLHRYVSKGLAAALVLCSTLILIFFALVFITSTIIPSFSRFITDFPEISQQVQNLIKEYSYGLIGEEELSAAWAELQSASIDALKGSVSIVFSLFNKVIDFVIIVFVTFYLLKDGEMIKKYLANLFPSRDYTRVLALFNRILSSLRAYIVSQLIICCLTAVIVFCYYTLRGLPYAPVAAVSGIAEFIPVLGPTIASAFGVVLTATVSPSIALQTILFYVILTQCNHNLVYPNIIGRTLNLHPVAIILGIILGGELLGAAGMFLAVPFIVIVKLVIEDIYHDRIERRDRQQLAQELRRYRNKKKQKSAMRNRHPSD